MLRVLALSSDAGSVLGLNNVEDQLDATNKNFFIFQSAQHISVNFCPSSGAQDLCFRACGIMHPSCCGPVAWKAETLTMCSV